MEHGEKLSSSKAAKRKIDYAESSEKEMSTSKKGTRATDVESPSSPKNKGKSLTDPEKAQGVANRPFFGVIDTVTSFSGVIEGPYAFGFAITITIDRQTFKGVVFKNDDCTPSDMLGHEAVVNHVTDVSPILVTHCPSSTPPPTPTTTTTATAVAAPPPVLPSIQSLIHHHNEPEQVSNSDQTHHGPLVWHNTAPSHSSGRISPEHNTSAPVFAPMNDVRGRSTSPPTPISNSNNNTPIQVFLHNILAPSVSQSQPSSPIAQPQPQQPSNLAIPTISQPSTVIPPSISTSGVAPLPPQPQLHRQKQRQKRRQEKKQQENQGSDYQTQAKVTLLGDDSLVDLGVSILTNLGTNMKPLQFVH